MFETEDLARNLLNIHDSRDVGIDELSAKLYDKFEISLETFEKLVCALAPYAARWESPLTKKIYSGFVDKKAGHALFKIEE